MSAVVAQAQEFKQLRVSDIRINGGTQPRERIDDELVTEYAEAMKAGAEFPAVVVFFDGVDYWLADGFHRTHAARRADETDVLVELHTGTKRDAVLYSVGANAAHGQRRTPADKWKAVQTLLNDEKWSTWNDSEIARHANVDRRFVKKVRESHLSTSTSDDLPPPRTYTTKHGTTATMNTANIGRRAETAAETSTEKPRNEKPEPRKTESRGVGLRHAHEAIAALKRIPLSDGLRDDAFDTVINWIKDNRS